MLFWMVHVQVDRGTLEGCPCNVIKGEWCIPTTLSQLYI